MSSPMDLQSRQAWPTTFFFRGWRDHGAEAPEILEHLYSVKAREKSNIASGIAAGAKSPKGLYESPFDLFETDHPGLLKLRKFVVDSVCSAAVIVNGSKLSPNDLALEFESSWCHITSEGGFHDAHYHPSCSWCGIYYLKAGDSRPGSDGAPGNGVNRFYSPIPTGGTHSDFGSEYLSSNRIDITPQDGLLFLFPSYLLHSALPYEGTTDRVIISFNARVFLASELEGSS